MPSYITLELVDGVRVVVPDSLEQITAYILQEQRDWFEDELRFLRRLIRPGQKAIDIGANVGVYALTLARLVGPTGHVWAFEPASSTANLLAAGAAANNFTNLEILREALSSAPGTAQLSLNENSELNELVRAGRPGSTTEIVSCVTLDDAMSEHGWQDIDFVKIDAEGEETNILRAGARFLATESPLIQFEIKEGTGRLNLDLIERFSELGYNSYRLVPGLDLLIPFDIPEAVDAFLLNLFCCKPDKAARLAEQGFLIETISGAATAPPLDPRTVSNRVETHGWRKALVAMPYGGLLANEWTQYMSRNDSRAVDEPLLYYALARDSSLNKAERFAALEASYQGFKQLCETQPTNLRLSSLARVAIEYGAREVGVSALGKLHDRVLQQGNVQTSEPFLAPGVRFDSLPPGTQQAVPGWIIAAVFEELERSQHYSSYFTGKAGRRRLEMIRDLGFASDEMRRRLALIQRRFGA